MNWTYSWFKVWSVIRNYENGVDWILVWFNPIIGNRNSVIFEHEIIRVWFRNEISSSVCGVCYFGGVVINRIAL